MVNRIHYSTIMSTWQQILHCLCRIVKKDGQGSPDHKIPVRIARNAIQFLENYVSFCSCCSRFTLGRSSDRLISRWRSKRSPIS